MKKGRKEIWDSVNVIKLSLCVPTHALTLCIFPLIHYVLAYNGVLKIELVPSNCPI